MKSIALVGAGLAAAVAASASAQISLQVVYDGFVSNSGGARHVYSVFVVTTDPNHVLLNVINHSVAQGSMSGVEHNDNDVLDEGPGTWNPSFTIGAAQRANDSFVTITGLTGSSALTNLDPSFGSGGGSTIPAAAGWFHGGNPPGTSMNVAGNRIKIMQIAGSSLANTLFHYTGQLTIGYKANASATDPLYANNLNYTIGIPAPGALALLGIAGLTSRRRRA